MMKPVHPIAAGVVGTVILLLVVGGCGHSTGTDHDAAGASGAKYLLDAEPVAAQSVVDVRALLEEKKAPADVVVVGRISGLSQPTWDPERAAFMVADLSLAMEEETAKTEHDETPKHDDENCPFCRVKKEKELAGLALVQVVDSSGSIPSVDARQLLGLREGQTIVVRGQGQIDKLGTVVVRTSGIYVRP
jgi:hypothetical protein